MEYIAYGGVITNRLLYTDKTCIQDIMGGSGFYSFSALRLCTPKALLVAGVGPDFDEFYGKWMDHNLCSRAGQTVAALCAAHAGNKAGFCQRGDDLLQIF
mgnify:CR=1 FL=1